MEAWKRPVPTDPAPAQDDRPLLRVAGLALAAAVSLGLARFSYALLLPPMRTDLGWSYLTAGAMNTLNAAGYLVGALLAPAALARWRPRPLLLGGGAATAVLLAAHGATTGTGLLLGLRAATGVASAAVFVAGGLLAARLAATDGAPSRGAGRRPTAGSILGLYYGGTGLGIVAATLLVPPLAGRAAPHAWQAAWIALAGTAALATLATAVATRTAARAGTTPRAARSRATPDHDHDHDHDDGGAAAATFPARRFIFGLTGYFLFGVGYIGYMTFIVTLLRDRGASEPRVAVFYGLLGAAVVASSFVWAGWLQRERGGRALSRLCALLAVATALPVLGTHPAAVFASGLLFGGVFLAVVASTTALVRHNLPPAAWPAGIAAFTTVFAAGQIVGPVMVGRLADGVAGLRGGLAASAAVLLLGAAIAARQRPLDASSAAR